MNMAHFNSDIRHKSCTAAVCFIGLIFHPRRKSICENKVKYVGEKIKVGGQEGEGYQDWEEKVVQGGSWRAPMLG